MTEVAEIEKSELIGISAETASPAQPLARVHVADRKLPLLLEPEPLLQRVLGLVMIVAICALYAFTLKSFWAPADGGVDQNAYLMGGKQIALHGSTRFAPEHPFEYVGAMMIVPTKKVGESVVANFAGGYYPKYPFGQSLLFAIPQILLGRDAGVYWAFAINPICAVLAVAGTFFLARAVAGSFAAILAAILLATSPVMFVLANGANSHPSCVACVVWGMFFLVRWWQTNSIWRGAIAGFLLAYACLIRYSEGLLILPIVAVAMMKLRWRDWRSYLRNAVPVLAWLIPIATLFIYNKITIGQLTGYDASNESEFGAGFRWEKLLDTWDLALRTFHDMALFFTLPLGIVGLIMLFARNWRIGVAIILWPLPIIALYMSYYWSPERGVSYARFFLSALPAVLVGVAVCVRFGIMRLGELDRTWANRIALPIAAGVVVAIASGVGTLRSIQNDENAGVGGFAEILPAQLQGRLSLASAGQLLRKHVKEGSVVFAEDVRGPNGATNYLAYAIDGRLFTFTAFGTGGGSRGMRFGNQDPDAPSPQQKQRNEISRQQYENKNDRDLINEQNIVTDEALATGNKVFLFGSQSSIDSFKKKFYPPSRYELVAVDRWKDPPPPREVPTTTQPSQQFRRNRGGGGGGPGGGGPGGGGPGNVIRNFMPGGQRANDWRLMEVQKKSPPPAKPSTSEPATTPASTQP